MSQEVNKARICVEVAVLVVLTAATIALLLSCTDKSASRHQRSAQEARGKWQEETI